MNNTDIKVPPIDEMIKRGTTPNYIKETIDKIKEILTKDKFINELLFQNNLVPNKESQYNNPLEIRYHGSYARYTDSFYFNKLEKSDIDIYIKVGSYRTRPSIFKTRDGKDKNFDQFLKQWTPGIKDNLHTFYDMGATDYRPIYNFSKFKNDLSNYLRNKLTNCVVENNNKVIKITQGTLSVELAICGGFSLDLNNNAKSLPWVKDIINHFKDKKTDVSNYIENRNNYISINGINLITSDCKEIQNFPEINNINVAIKNKNTNGNFSKYVRYLKNLVKFVKEKQNIVIPIKSYHLECLFYYANNDLFKSWNSKEELRNNLLKFLSVIGNYDLNDFNLQKEINGILRLNRSLSYEDYKVSMINLIFCINNI